MFEDPVPLPPMMDHSIRRWEPIMRRFVEVSEYCSRTIRVYGPALVEYPRKTEGHTTCERIIRNYEIYW